MIIKKCFTPALALIILLSGCAGIVEITGQFLDGSVLAEKTLSRYRAYKEYGAVCDIDIEIVENKNKESSIIISVSDFPMIKLRGTLPGNDGVFYFSSLEYLSGSTHGWNEYTSQLYGSGRLVLREIAVLETIEQPFQVQVTQGRVHRYDTRVTGNEALTAMRNRYERVTTLAQWMLSSGRMKGQPLKEFEKYWKPILFPEIAAGKQRPEGWRQGGDIFKTAEDINWNTSYTERVFPPELVPVRDSGTMLRDWEEALSLVYLEYEWERLINIISDKIILYKVK